MKSMMKKTAITLMALLFATTLFYGQASAAPTRVGNIEIHKPWVRAVPPTSKTSAAYMGILNHADSDDHLVSAESDIAKAVELHNVRKKDGMMEMYQVKSIGIPAKGKQKLRPGSYHVMLIGLNRQPKEGEIIEVKLNFMHAGSVTIKAPVKKGGMMKKMMMHNMQ